MADTIESRKATIKSLSEHPGWKAFIAEVAADRTVIMAANMEPVPEWHHGRYRGVVDHCGWVLGYCDTTLAALDAEATTAKAPDVALLADDYEENETA